MITAALDTWIPNQRVPGLGASFPSDLASCWSAHSEAEDDKSISWVPATQVGEPQPVLGSWVYPAPHQLFRSRESESPNGRYFFHIKRTGIIYFIGIYFLISWFSLSWNKLLQYIKEIFKRPWHKTDKNWNINSFIDPVTLWLTMYKRWC